MRRRAIFFTFDSLVAIIVVSFAAFSIFSGLSKLEGTTFSENSLAIISSSAMASLEKDGTFASSVSNSTGILTALSSLPPAVCWQINLDREDGASLSSSKKAGCQCGQERVLARRAVVFRNSTGPVLAIATGRFCFQ